MAQNVGIRHYVLTLSGAVQNIATALGLVQGGTIATEPAFRELHFEPLVGNANEAYVGQAGSTVSATNYAFRIPIPATTFFPKIIGPYANSGPLKLSSLEIIGTNTQKIMIMGVLY